MALTAGSRDIGRGDLGVRILDSGDGMFAMAIGADRCVAYTVLDGLAVDTAQKCLVHILVAFSAGGRNILPVKFRGGIGGLVQAVGSMAIRTVGRVQFALFEQGNAMDALFV